MADTIKVFKSMTVLYITSKDTNDDDVRDNRDPNWDGSVAAVVVGVPAEGIVDLTCFPDHSANQVRKDGVSHFTLRVDPNGSFWCFLSEWDTILKSLSPLMGGNEMTMALSSN